jgi:hypothetical protein
LSTRAAREFEITHAIKGRKKGTICLFGIPNPASVNAGEKSLRAGEKAIG